MALRSGLQHTPWPGRIAPERAQIEQDMLAEGLTASWWSNGPDTRYNAHSHPYHKVLYCLNGSIRFLIQRSGPTFDLAPGDRLDIPPNTQHSAVVGPAGVTCAESPRG